MPKISGKFAPLTTELGNDERFIIKSTDLDKLLYVLIIYTCHMTNHQAPIDPKFYKIRYGLRSKSGQIAESLRRVRDMYPKLSWGDKTLSLLNSPTYEIGKRLEVDKEVEEEIEEIKTVSANKKHSVLKPEPQKRFSPPSLEEVVSFFATMGRTDGETFFYHYTSNGWKVGGKTKMVSWHAAAKSWNNRNPVKKEGQVNRRATKYQGIPSNPNRIGLPEICPTNSQTSLINQ